MRRRSVLAHTFWFSLVAFVAVGCEGDADAPKDDSQVYFQGPGTIQFAPVNAPTSDQDKRQVIASSHVTINGQQFPLSFVTEARSGSVFGNEIFGRLIDREGKPLTYGDGSDIISPSNDFASILKVGSKLFEVTHFETTPAAMYLSELSQDTEGQLSIVSTRPIDFSEVNGLWIPCAGSVSPWNTHLGSEEYPADARLWETATTLGELGAGNMLRYWGIRHDEPPADEEAAVAEAKQVFNPYNYGFVTEVSVSENGETSVKKHYAAGRRALELSYVMPDQKTVYMTDDGINDAFYMFVAKTPGDLSEGQLYAARWFQTSPPGQPNGAADIYWLPLGPSATNDEVRNLIDSGVVFSDIFETEEPDLTTGSCPSAADGFVSVVVDATYTVKTECLRLKPDRELAASRLESRRYAAYVGATTEFRKNEGITFNPDANRLYVSFSEINSGAIDQHATYDLGGPNHLRLAESPCGAVYQYTIAPDTEIGSDYVAHAASALVEGVWLANPNAPNPYPPDSPYAGRNTCSVNRVSNPDNLAYMRGYDTLLIGEDSGVEHQNDAVWAYNVVTRQLTRILTAPYGAETTGVYFYPDINGHAYIKVQVQHPYGESDQAQLVPDSGAWNSYTGHLGPLPAFR